LIINVKNFAFFAVFFVSLREMALLRQPHSYCSPFSVSLNASPAGLYVVLIQLFLRKFLYTFCLAQNAAGVILCVSPYVAIAQYGGNAKL